MSRYSIFAKKKKKNGPKKFSMCQAAGEIPQNTCSKSWFNKAMPERCCTLDCFPEVCGCTVLKFEKVQKVPTFLENTAHTERQLQRKAKKGFIYT